jgi:hypothetical protein
MIIKITIIAIIKEDHKIINIINFNLCIQKKIKNKKKNKINE